MADTQAPDGGSVIPTVDVVPLYLPNDIGDIYASADVGAVISVVPRSDPPTDAEIGAGRACAIDLLTNSMRARAGSYKYFEDPGQVNGDQSAATIAAPPPPPSRPTCTPNAAAAAARIRTINDEIRWQETVVALEASPEVAGARAQEIDCLHASGIDDVEADGYITDGWYQRNPDLAPRAPRIFSDCMAPVFDARSNVRAAARADYLETHSEQIARLQAAFDEYLTAIYDPAAARAGAVEDPDADYYVGRVGERKRTVIVTVQRQVVAGGFQPFTVTVCGKGRLLGRPGSGAGLDVARAKEGKRTAEVAVRPELVTGVLHSGRSSTSFVARPATGIPECP